MWFCVHVFILVLQGVAVSVLFDVLLESDNRIFSLILLITGCQVMLIHQRNADKPL